jgi:glucose/arabinose dehydrogenase/putative cell wall-binding protein
MRRRRTLATAFSIAIALAALPGAAGRVAAAPPTLTTTVIASSLSIPWDVAFLPDGRMLVTERAGRIRIYSTPAAGASLVQTITVPSVRAEGESGLMGIAVDIDFATNRHVYVCASRDYAGSGGWKNQVLRYTLSPSLATWSAPTVLLTGAAANTTHNGCAVEMDRFGRLWVSIGDAANAANAQNRASLNGKVLRINRDGTIPADNPVIAGVRNAVYSMGHRNPQGIAIRPGTDQVYAAEHGPDVNDEVNLIVAGGNYGWPCYTGFGTPYLALAGCGPASAYREPMWASGGATLATSGAAFAAGAQWGDFDGNLFVSTLKESDVRRFAVDAAGTTFSGPTIHFDGTSGRLRAMVYGPGGQLYVTTSNGSGDQVIRISATQPATTRIAGADRYATAAALSAASFPSGASTAIVATGLDFPDALAGSAAAGHLGAPVLLVRPDQVPAATATELTRLAPQDIFVLGGTSAVSEAVRLQLGAFAGSGTATRIAGADRYASAVAVSKQWYGPGVAAAFIATGTDFADALAGTPPAAMADSPLLLVRPGSIPAATAAELQRLAPQRIYVLGGTAVVSPAVASQLAQFTSGPVTRLAGADRYATGAAVARWFWGRVTPRAYVASGRSFADALAGGAVAGRDARPLLLVGSTSVPFATGAQVLRLAPPQLVVLGGTAVVAPAVELRLRALIGTP